MTVKIKPAEEKHINDLIALLDELFSLESDFTTSHEKQRKGIELIFEKPELGIIYVAEVDQKTVGMISLLYSISTSEGAFSARIEDLVVRRDFSRCGIATALLEQVEKTAAEKGITRLQLLADKDNRIALDFYRLRNWYPTSLTALHRFLS